MRELALVLSALIAAPVYAHGRPPNVGQIAVDPNDPSRIVVQFSYGLLASEDGGASFRFACASAFGSDPTIEDPPFAIADDGGVVIGTFDGIERGEPDLCSFAPAPAPVTDTFVIHVARGPDAMWAATARVPDPDTLSRSEDGGRTWTMVSVQEAEMLLEHIAPAPSDPMRLYLGGFMRPTSDTPRRGFVLRSDDAGRTFVRIEIPLIPDEQTPHVVGVDPTDADRIFVRVRKADADTSDERLLYSEDGGDTFDEVLVAPAMEGFAISPDGQSVWVGSADGGLYRAQGGTTFVRIGDTSIRGMALSPDGTLWMSVEPYVHRFALARSDDGGDSVVEALWLEDVTEIVACEICSQTYLMCNEYLADLIYDVDRFLGPMTMEPPVRSDGGLLEACKADGSVLPFDAGRPRDAGGAMDAGRMDASMTMMSDGCGCRASQGGSGWLLALAILFFWRRR